MRRLILLALVCGIGVLHAQELYQMPQGTASRMSSMENLNGARGQGGKRNNGAKGRAFTSLKAGQSQTLLETTGAGIIQRIWCTIDNRTPEMLRGLRLRMYWDASTTPAVDVPLGDFFCVGVGRVTPFQSALFASPEGRSFNCYIPMPFRSGAKVVLTNETTKDLSLLFFDVDFVTLERPAENQPLYFHATWNRKQYPVGQDVALLPLVKGRGRFLGVSVGLNVNPLYGESWWGEGEVKMYIDGDSTYPTINGTGSEDYVGTGWGEGVFSHQYQGCLVADDKQRQYAFYRFHVPDAIYFDHDFKATIQQIGGWFPKPLQALRDKGVDIPAVSLGGTPFIPLLEPGVDAKAELQKADPKTWENFYRSDDYAVTAYYYLDWP